MKVALLKMGAKNGGGLEKYAARIASGFLERSAEVTFLTTAGMKKTSLLIQYVPYSLCKWPTFLRLEQYDRCVRWSLNHKPFDIVFGMERNRSQTHIRAGNGVHAAFLKSRLASEGPFKYKMCLLNPLHKKILELEKAGFENPKLKKIFANSHMVKKNILDHYNVDPSKIEVIHNGVEWKELETPFLSWEKKESDVLQLLFVGNGFRRKGLDPLLEALSKTKNVHLSVVGKDKHLGRYEAKAEKLGLGERVRFFGPVKEVLPHYLLADALIIPSFYDPFANVTLEALSLGLKVISSKGNGGHEILTEQNGIVLENLDPPTLLAAIEKTSRKTASSAQIIRASVSHLDFDNQLSKLIDACY
jgi:UDP-glucose:(heptosyl)LPS alpha-1,3-glucosyltransferase